MIQSSDDKDTEDLWYGESPSCFQAIQKRAKDRLSALNAASQLRDLFIPSYRLERLKRSGKYSIRINEQYRICFRWEEGDAFDVEIADYHH